jgi:hypothetical protein
MRRAILMLPCLVLFALAACSHDRDSDGPDAMPMGGGADAGAPIAFMETCDPADDQCDEDLVCFPFNAKGPHCTRACTMDEDCEEPSTGCNNMGVCKAP